MLRMAWRNLWRNRRRTLITLASIAFGVLLAVTMLGISNYKYYEMIAQSTRMGLGHVSVLPKGYQEAPSFKLRLRGTAALRGLALGRPGVTAVLPRVEGPALFATAARNVGGVFFALDPALERPQDNSFLESINAGALFKDRDASTAVVGAGLATKLKLGLGRKMVVTVSDVHGQMSSILVRVCGTFQTGVEEVDGGGILLPLGTAQKLLGYGPDEATALAVVLADERDSEATAVGLGAAIRQPDVEVLPWKDALPQVWGLIQVDKVGRHLILLVLSLMIAMGVLNTSLMSVIERRREFGVMLALGLSPWDLIRLVLTEALLTGLVGLSAGGVVSAPWIWYLQAHGIDLRAMVKGNGNGVEVNGAMLKPIFHAIYYPETVALIVGTALGLVLAAGIYPAWKAGSVPPVEAIRND
jgi:ABC-type lipoprotein release transport system permease subunit